MGSNDARRAPRVIVVHADAAQASACCDALREWGFAPFVTSDGEDALRMAAELRPVAMVIDLDLRDVDPLDVAHAVRAYSLTREIAVIALVRSLARDVVELVTERGCDALIMKPADGERIAADVSCLVRRARRSTVTRSGTMSRAETPAPRVSGRARRQPPGEEHGPGPSVPTRPKRSTG